MGIIEAQAEVTRRFSALGLPAWPGPHPDREPLSEEYSRVTDPQRYDITHARAGVWVEVLRDTANATATPVDVSESFPVRAAGIPRGICVTSPRPGTLPLYLLEYDARIDGVDDVPGGLTVSIVNPRLELGAFPDCGCDACDYGSESLLEAVDDAIASVVGGPFVLLKGDGWTAQWSPGTWRSSGVGGRTRARARARKRNDDLKILCQQLAADIEVELPPDTRAYVGGPWLP